ncbi:MAG: fumarylacetoacetate hydrolase family protein [Betaproteobacteria bacterium]|nr:fumarylacetoacetate hydrolase family protein [Betaproteobacteria bacterium]
MKLATIKNDTRDGALAVVSRDLRRAQIAFDVAPTLQAALDDWGYCAPQLQNLSDELNRQPGGRAFAFDPLQCLAPLPRAYQWLDGSSYLPHIKALRKARGAGMPPDARRDPLMYQGNSDYFIGACDPIEAASEAWEIDLEGELGVILGDVPMAVKHERAGEEIRLFVLINDVSLRAVLAREFRKGLGPVQGKIATAFSPVAVTADELGAAWDGRRVSRPLRVSVNDETLGEPDCGSDMQFDFPHLIAHAARTRRLGAGTVLGSGTVSNQGHAAGHACIAERRATEAVAGRDPLPFLRFGDRVRIEMLDAAGHSIFGAIDQRVVQYPAPRRALDALPGADAEQEASAVDDAVRGGDEAADIDADAIEVAAKEDAADAGKS